MKLIDKLSFEDQKALKKGVIEVSGKHMNRTAIGIIDALFKLYPSMTFAELKEMVPDTLNPSAPKNYKSLFKPYTERLYGVIQSGAIRNECEKEGLDLSASHFIQDDEVFHTSDGIEVLVAKSWESKDTETGNHDLQQLINHVAQFGVRVVSFEAKDLPFEKGGYHLKVVQPIILKKLTQPAAKKFPWWLLAAILVVTVGTAIYFAFK
jgi:hypothetical protein